MIWEPRCKCSTLVLCRLENKNRLLSGKVYEVVFLLVMSTLGFHSPASYGMLIPSIIWISPTFHPTLMTSYQ